MIQVVKMDEMLEDIKRAYFLTREARNILQKYALFGSIELDTAMGKMGEQMKNIVYKNWCMGEGDFYDTSNVEITVKRN